MKWNRLNISIDFDKFWKNYYLILVNSQIDSEKRFDAEDFQTWLMLSTNTISCPVLSILFYRYCDSNYVWGLVSRSEEQKFREMASLEGINKFVITPIQFQESFNFYVSDPVIQKRILTQLFINYVEKDPLWSNISGKCLVNITKEITNHPERYQIFLEFKLDKNLFLSINVRTYTESSSTESEKIKKLTPYILDEERGCIFRRAFPEFDDLSNKKIFRFFAPRNKKNVFPFLSLKLNQSCKIQYLAQLIKRLKKSAFSNLGVFEIDFEDIGGTVLELGSNDTFELLLDKIDKFQVVLDDECDCADEYFKLWNEDKQEKIQYQIYHNNEVINLTIPTIVIVHEEKYYTEKKMEDRYKSLMDIKSPLIQHIQIETLCKETKVKTRNKIIDRAMTELLLKMSINKGKIPIHSKNGSKFPNLTFCIPVIEILSKDENGKDIKTIACYAVCTLDSDNKIKYDIIDKYSSQGIKLYGLYNYYNSSPEWKGVAKPACFIWKNNSPETIYSILHLQNALQMPEYSLLYQYLERNKEFHKKYFKKNDYVEMYKSLFLELKIPLKKYNNYLESIINIETENIIPKELPRLTKDKAGVTMEKLFYWNADPANPYHNLPVTIPWRTVASYFGLPLRIGYTRTAIPISSTQDIPCVLYYSGYRSGYNTKDNDIKACRFRALVSEDTDDLSIWNEIHPLLDTDFITQIDAFTVLPFPVKLLREYVIIKNRERAMKDNIQFELDFAFD